MKTRLLWPTTFALFGLLFSACQPQDGTGTKEEVETEVVELVVEEEETATEVPTIDIVDLPDNYDYYVEGQFIVSGPESGVTAAIEAVQNSGFELERQIRLPISELFGNPLFEQENCSLPQVERKNQELVIDVYNMGSEITVNSITTFINNTLSITDVYAEPNFRTGRPVVPLEGDPWHIGGSPWHIGGSGGGLAPGVPELLSQWALMDTGVHVYEQSGVRVPTVDGSKIRVGIFDTSPFDGKSYVETIGWIDDELQLKVTHPTFQATLPAPTGKELGYTFKDHGLFVASLVYSVAPKTDIHLIRVLDDYVRGDLGTLNVALHNFISDTLDDSSDLDGAVINLSLGVHPPPEEENQDPVPAEVISLLTYMETARCLGIQVVAASGNDSASANPPESMQIPAQWNATLGVGASNISSDHSCFSNEGDLGAPGGEGGNETCEVKIESCPPVDATTPGEPEYCVLGAVTEETYEEGFAYSAGTSFSAPLVTGLTALLLEVDAQPLSDVLSSSGTNRSDFIFGILKSNAVPLGSKSQYLGVGIVKWQ